MPNAILLFTLCAFLHLNTVCYIYMYLKLLFNFTQDKFWNNKTCGKAQPYAELTIELSK